MQNCSRKQHCSAGRLPHAKQVLKTRSASSRRLLLQSPAHRGDVRSNPSPAKTAGTFRNTHPESVQPLVLETAVGFPAPQILQTLSTAHLHARLSSRFAARRLSHWTATQLRRLHCTLGACPGAFYCSTPCAFSCRRQSAHLLFAAEPRQVAGSTRIARRPYYTLWGTRTAPLASRLK